MLASHLASQGESSGSSTGAPLVPPSTAGPPSLCVNIMGGGAKALVGSGVATSSAPAALVSPRSSLASIARACSMRSRDCPSA
jgi:hypothetical protein